MFVDLSNFGWANANLRPLTVIGIITVRNQRIQPIVASREFQHDEDPGGTRGLSRKRFSGPREQTRDTHQTRRTNANSVQAGLQQFSSSDHRFLLWDTG